MKNVRTIALLASNLVIAAACGGGGGGGTSCPIADPDMWSAPAWNTNAAEALALRAQLDALVGATGMRGAEQGTVTVNRAQLDTLYNAGTTSVADVTTAYYNAVVDQSFDEFLAAIDAGPGDPINSGMWTPGANGGIFAEAARAMNAGGIEVRQIVDKGLYAGGAFYNYAVRLTAGTITPATIDAIAAAWGSNENLDPNGPLTDSANYSNQMRFFETIAEALTDAKAYAAESNCTEERDQALVIAFRNWEQSMLARTVYYANVMKTELETPGATDDDLINGLHELGEGLGLALGFRGITDPTTGPLAGAATTITDADVNQIAAAVGVDQTDFNASTTGLFVEDPDAFAGSVAELEGVVANVYDLTEADIAAYRTPTGD